MSAASPPSGRGFFVCYSLSSPPLRGSWRRGFQNQQEAMAEAWKPYVKDLDTLYTDAICYERAMRHPTWFFTNLGAES